MRGARPCSMGWCRTCTLQGCPYGAQIRQWNWSGSCAWLDTTVDRGSNSEGGTYLKVPSFYDEMKVKRQASDESHSGCPASLPEPACIIRQLQLNVPVVKPIVSPAPRLPRLEGAEPPLFRQH